MRVLEVVSERHGLDILNHVFRLVPQSVYLVLVSPSEALPHDQIDEELRLLVRYSLSHVEEAV